MEGAAGWTQLPARPVQLGSVQKGCKNSAHRGRDAKRVLCRLRTSSQIRLPLGSAGGVFSARGSLLPRGAASEAIDMPFPV